MKKITKILSIALASFILLMSFASCGLIEDTAEVERVENMKKLVLTLDGDIEVKGATYGWYYSNAYNSAYSKASEELEADSSAASDAEVKVDIEQVKKDTLDSIAATKLACKKAKEAGIKLSGEDYKNIEAQIEQYRSSMIASFNQQGMAISYNDYLRAMNTNADAVADIMEEEYLASLYWASFVKDDYVTAKHILIKYGEGEHTKEEATAIAADIKAQLDGGADFDKLMKEKSEDKGADGSVNSPEGYTFKKDGSMVPEFEAAAFSLNVDQISAPVEVQSAGYNGFHILKRIDTILSGVAMNVSLEDVEEKRAELIKDVKAEYTDLIDYFTVEY